MTAFISIPKPCSENWNEMGATEKGAFCSKCTKEVIDCTSVKTSEIKAKIGAQKNPCVRIFEDQIDEMNFLEWFKSLTIKIQLKYAFLFAFLIVFNTNVKAQDTLIPPEINLAPSPAQNDSCHQGNGKYQLESGVQFIDADSLESIVDTTLQTADSSLTKAIDSCVKTLETPELAEEPIIPHDALISWLPNKPEEYELIIMGDYSCPIVYGDWIVTTPVELSSPYLANKKYAPDLITNSNELPLNNSRFSFYIEGDSLRFMSYAVEPERIRISITKKGEITPFYFTPIQIERGKSEILFPLNDFDNGAYVITVHGEQESKAIEIVYW